MYEEKNMSDIWMIECDLSDICGSIIDSIWGTQETFGSKRRTDAWWSKTVDGDNWHIQGCKSSWQVSKLALIVKRRIKDSGE